MMKKILSLLFLLVGLAGITPAIAQQELHNIPVILYSELPVTPAYGTLRHVVDSDGTDCNGDGALQVLCRYNGSAWVMSVPAVDSGAAAGGGTSLADDGNFTPGTTDGTPAMGVYEATPTACTDGDACIAAINENRAWHTIEQGAWSDATDSIQISGSDDGGTTARRIKTSSTGIVKVDTDAGASVHYRTSTGTTEDEHEIKATAGRLFSVTLTNTNAAARYIRCYNLTAANTTPGTSTVFLGFAIPGSTAGAGATTNFGPKGIAFSTALTCAFTTGAADTDVAEVAANEIKAVYVYE